MHAYINQCHISNICFREHFLPTKIPIFFCKKIKQFPADKI